MDKPFVLNYGNTGFAKNLLFSHLTAPLHTVAAHHNNYLECLYSIDVFHDLGFNVDVYDYRYKGEIDYTRYDVIYGFGHPWSGAFNRNEHRPLAVYYAMISHPFHVFRRTMQALRNFYERNGLWLKESGRYVLDVDFVAEPFYADALVVLGNEYSRSVYAEFCRTPSYGIMAPYYESTRPEDLSAKNYGKAQNHFLWFGSNNLIHKGLDVTLEAFANRPGAVLHICAMPKETRFFAFYKDILALPNIQYHGFFDIRSKRFRHLMNECAFCICPSWAEGQVTSVVNAMANGLIPIVSVDCGIEREKNFVFELPENSVSEVDAMISRCLAMDSREVEALSRQCLESTRTLHSKTAYCAKLKENLAAIMGGNGLE